MRRPTEVAAGLAVALLTACAATADTGFGAWDRDADGTVSREEFRQGAGRAGLYRTWDRDGDGLLSRQEYVAGPATIPRFETTTSGDLEPGEDEWADESEILDGAFDSYDEDGSLWLDKDEFGRFERQLGPEGVYR